MAGSLKNEFDAAPDRRAYPVTAADRGLHADAGRKHRPLKARINLISTLLGLGIESGGGAALSDAVPHRDRLTPDGGGVADQFAELVDVELLSDGFGMGDEVLNFLLHGMVLSFWGGFPPLAFIVIFLP